MTEHDPLAWLAGTDVDTPERPQETVSEAEDAEGHGWVSPLRAELESRAARNRHRRGCECLRCSPLIHGAYEANPEITAEVASLAPLLPDEHPANRVPLELLAVARVRLARAMRALTTADEEGRLEDCLRLSADARGWLVRAERLAEKLALTPASRAGLGLTRAETVRAELAALAEAADVSQWSDSELQAVVGLLEKARPEERP